MTDKERLEEVKRIADRIKTTNSDIDYESSVDEFILEHMEWVVKQAEKAQELEELKPHYMKQIQELTKFNDKGIKENKRLREALKTVLTPEAYEKFKEVGVEGIKPIEWRLE